MFSVHSWHRHGVMRHLAPHQQTTLCAPLQRTSRGGEARMNANGVPVLTAGAPGAGTAKLGLKPSSGARTGSAACSDADRVTPSHPRAALPPPSHRCRPAEYRRAPGPRASPPPDPGPAAAQSSAPAGAPRRRKAAARRDMPGHVSVRGSRPSSAPPSRSGPRTLGPDPPTPALPHGHPAPRARKLMEPTAARARGHRSHSRCLPRGGAIRPQPPPFVSCPQRPTRDADTGGSGTRGH